MDKHLFSIIKSKLRLKSRHAYMFNFTVEGKRVQHSTVNYRTIEFCCETVGVSKCTVNLSRYTVNVSKITVNAGVITLFHRRLK